MQCLSDSVLIAQKAAMFWIRRHCSCSYPGATAVKPRWGWRDGRLQLCYHSNTIIVASRLTATLTQQVVAAEQCSCFVASGMLFIFRISVCPIQSGAKCFIVPPHQIQISVLFNSKQNAQFPPPQVSVVLFRAVVSLPQSLLCSVESFVCVGMVMPHTPCMAKYNMDIPFYCVTPLVKLVEPRLKLGSSWVSSVSRFWEFTGAETGGTMCFPFGFRSCNVIG